jgi:hypothetical protein
MTDALVAPLTILGGAAAVCEGDVCELPQQRDALIVNSRLDDNQI